jgi:hypothetical protein
MKLACLLSLNGGVTFLGIKRNLFRSTELGRLPFLATVRPVNLAPVSSALAAGACSEQGTRPVGCAGWLEVVALKSVGMMFVLAILGCGFGAQHIAYAREKEKLGRQLRQRELELRAISQAYRSLESEKALFLAQGFSRAEQLARGDCIRDTAAATVGRPTFGRESRLAPANARGHGDSNQRSHVADARPPARRGGIRS